MLNRSGCVALLFGFAAVFPPCVAGAPSSVAPLALRGVNPDMLSSGLFAALDQDGVFGPPPAPPRARAGIADLSKGQPPAVLDARVGLNVRLGDDPPELPSFQRGQAEPHLIRSVFDPQLLLATFQDGRYFDGGALTCGYAVSRDGGFTWTRAPIPGLTVLSGGPYLRATDPVAAAGPSGELYLNNLVSLGGNLGFGAITVSRSNDQGRSWSPPSVVFQTTTAQALPDKNWIAANDYAAAPNPGRLVVTWTNFTSNANGASTGNHLLAAVSDDRGVTWSAPALITPAGSANQGTQPVFLPDGSLVVVYATFLIPGSVSTFSLHSKRSLDGGRTFPGAASTIVPLVNTWGDAVIRHGTFLPSATVARNTGEIFVTFVGVLNTAPQVFVTKSSNQGATWSTPTIVSDQPAGVSVMNPTISTTPDGRSVSVLFTDKRLGPDENFVDHFVALSVDGGTTWQPNFRVSEMSSDVRFAARTSRGYMLGDYLGFAAPPSAEQPAAAIWIDTRTGDADPVVTRILPTPIGGYFNWQRVQGLQVGPYANYFDYVHGVNPLKRESGEFLALKRTASGDLHVYWTQRQVIDADAGGGNRSWIVYGSSPDLGSSGGFEGSSPVLSSSELPTLPLRPGLVWAGAKIPAPNAHVHGVARAVAVTGMSFAYDTPTVPIDTASRLINLSTRGRVGTDAAQLIAGFVVRGGQRGLFARGVGPTLATFGVTGFALDPAITLLGADGAVLSANDNYSTGITNGRFVVGIGETVGAFPLGSILEAGLWGGIPAGNYAVKLEEPGARGRIGLVEIYDASQAGNWMTVPDDGSFVNLSTRGEVGTGDGALIAGFVLHGTQPRRILIRAVGPSLAPFNVGGALLTDPILTLYRGAAAIATNDDWEISRSPEAVIATAQRIGAFALNRASLDAALLITLEPGNYTAVVSSADGATGIALVEIYDAN